MLKVRVKEWVLRKNQMLGSEERWLEVTKETEKAYLVKAEDLPAKEVWIPKSCVIQMEGKLKPKMYPISERWLFGLESMRDKCIFWLTCEYEAHADKEDQIRELQEECEELLSKCSRGYVDGKTFGRIKEITYQREWMRFETCLENGMPYNQAVQALQG